MRSVILFLILSCPLAFSQLWSGKISANRAVDWSSVGATIATRNTQCGSTISAYTGSAATINTAIAGCAAGDYVSLGAGTFNLSSGITFANHPTVTLRGQGAQSTFLVFTGDVNCFGLTTDICVPNNDNSYAGGPQHTATCTGCTQGATTVTFSSVTGLSIGSIVVIDQLNDSDTDTGEVWINETMGVSASEGPSGAERSGRAQSQIVKVTGISGSDVTFSPALYMPNWSSGKSPGMWWASSTETGAGIENLSLDHTLSGSDSGILFYNATNSWVKGIRSIDSNRNHVWWFQSSHITVRDSYFYQTQNHASESYGIEPYIASDNLAENNIFEKIAAPVTVNGSCSGCVFGYNYAINDLSAFSTALSASNWLHSAGVDYSLFEGNIGPAFFGDNIHGTHNFVTIFRNYLAGWYTSQTSQTWAILGAPGSRYFNMLGNVLGKSGYHNTYQGSSATSVYNLGNTINGLGPDSLVASTGYRFGNYDVVTNAVRWCGNSGNTGWVGICGSTSEVPTAISPYPQTVPAAQTFPASFYNSAQPAFWGSPFGTPPYPAIGPDVTGGNISGLGGFANKIPAELCYDNTPATGGILDFNPDDCYGYNPSVTPAAHHAIVQ